MTFKDNVIMNSGVVFMAASLVSGTFPESLFWNLIFCKDLITLVCAAPGI